MQNETQNITAVKENKNNLPTMCYVPSMTINNLIPARIKQEMFVRCVFYLPVCNYSQYDEPDNQNMKRILDGKCTDRKDLYETVQFIELSVHEVQKSNPQDKPWTKNRINGKCFLYGAAKNIDEILTYFDTIFFKYLLKDDIISSKTDTEAKINKQLENHKKHLVLTKDDSPTEESIGKKFFKLMLFEAILSSDIPFRNIPKKIIDFLCLKHQPLNSVKISLEDLPYDKLFAFCVTSEQFSLPEFFSLIDDCDDIIKRNSIDSQSWLPTFATLSFEYLKREIGTPLDTGTLKAIHHFFENKTKEPSLLSFSILLHIWQYVDKELVGYISQDSNTTPQIIRELYTEWGRINPNS